jgi:hypothetical protein
MEISNSSTANQPVNTGGGLPERVSKKRLLKEEGMHSLENVTEVSGPSFTENKKPKMDYGTTSTSSTSSTTPHTISSTTSGTASSTTPHVASRTAFGATPRTAFSTVSASSTDRLSDFGKLDNDNNSDNNSNNLPDKNVSSSHPNAGAVRSYGNNSNDNSDNDSDDEITAITNRIGRVVLQSHNPEPTNNTAT